MLRFFKRKKDTAQAIEHAEDVLVENIVEEEITTLEELSESYPDVLEEDEEVIPNVVPPDNYEETAPATGFFARLKQGLSRTRHQLTEGLARAFLGKKTIDEDLLEELETQLLLADVGVATTTYIINHLTERVTRKDLADPAALLSALKQLLMDILKPCEQPLVIDSAQKPFVLLMVGVNGAGKTTTIGKLAKYYQAAGKKVLLAAGDTFRAAAVEQLQVWGERNQIPVIAQHTGADSASVIYDALQAAKARGADLLIADTAGRLHTQQHLMEELKKIRRVMSKLDSQAPHEVLLIVDAASGQNALLQARQFLEAVQVSGICLTKMDGSAKGGMIFAIANELRLPLRFIGIGESVDDLRPFVAQDFVNALFADLDNPK